MILSCRVEASEKTFSLKEKISRSQVIALVTLTNEPTSKLEYYPQWDLNLPTAALSFSIDRFLKGTSEDKIIVKTVCSNATAGFSLQGHEKGRKFIAYLKKESTTEKGYILAEYSNQFLEKIALDHTKVADVGQGPNMVSLQEKLYKIRKIVAESR